MLGVAVGHVGVVRIFVVFLIMFCVIADGIFHRKSSI